MPLQNEDRKRALETVGTAVLHGMTDAHYLQQDDKCSAAEQLSLCRERVLAALEREFVLVRPVVNKTGFCATHSCKLCRLGLRRSCTAELNESERPGPDCPAHKEPKDG